MVFIATAVSPTQAMCVQFGLFNKVKINRKIKLKTFTNSVCLIVLLNIAVIGQGITIGSGTTFTGGSTTVTLSGNWTNSGTFTAGTSNVIFNDSSGNQTITNSGGETFNNLTVNKIGGDVQLSNNITVNGTLTLTSGDVDLNDKTITLGSSATLNDVNSTGIGDELAPSVHLENPSIPGSVTKFSDVFTVPPICVQLEPLSVDLNNISSDSVNEFNSLSS